MKAFANRVRRGARLPDAIPTGEGGDPSPSASLERAAPPAAPPDRRTEWWGFAGVTLLVAVAAVHLVAGGLLVGQDAATQFYPWYGYLGERLRGGDIPAWNPGQFGGAPFAGDPQSGWTYLPAMLAFSLLPLALAAPVFVVGHLALAAAATYALGRALGEGVIGALGAAAAYTYAGPVLGRAACCPSSYEVATWTPVLILGFERALRAHAGATRGAWWGFAGVALSQVLAAWIGQGAYYALLAFGAFAVYRTLFAPPHRPEGTAWTVSSRFGALVVHGGAVLAVGFGLAAAGILPRLDFNARSNLAGGEYVGSGAWAASVGGVGLDQLGRSLDPSLYYPGGAAVALAVVALLLVRGRLAVPYGAALGAATILLVLPVRTPFHALLYGVLPRFEALHRHWPERVTMVAYLAPALLAGTAIGALGRGARQHHPQALWRATAVPLFTGIAMLAVRPDTIWPAVAVTLAAGLVVVTPLLPARATRALPLLLLLLVVGDSLTMARALAARAPFGGFHRLDLDSLAATDGASAFLRERTRDNPARFFGYDPGLGTMAHGRAVLYRSRFADPASVALLVNNRATLLGLEDIQGYNPVQPARTVELLNALNGSPQEYHDANVLPAGLESPLLDLLGVRYVVVPAATPPGRDDLRRLAAVLPTVYLDAQVRVLERPGALPRAWLVHAARVVERGEALPLLATGTVDPRQEALVEGPTPPLAPAIDRAGDRVIVTGRGPERLSLATHTDAPALLVVAENADPGWEVTVDGRPTDILIADHLLRAVAVPAGDHVVEFRYAPRSLAAGIAISLGTAGVVMVGIAAAWWREQSRGRAIAGAPPPGT